MDAGIECLTEDQHFTFTGCYILEGINVTIDFPFGPREYGHNTATCGNACRMYKYMALRDNGFCSCANTVHFDNETASTECGAVCAGELDLGPIRYCGRPLRSAVYQVIHE